MITKLDPESHIHLNEVDSTNDYILNLKNPAAGLVVTASEQKAGKGRHGRKWYSSNHSSFIFSGLLKASHEDSESLALLSFATGLAVLTSLKKYLNTLKRSYENIVLKWPNDIVFSYGSSISNQKKAGGILVESKFHDGGFLIAVGVGLNWYDSAFSKLNDDSTGLIQPTSIFGNNGNIDLPEEHTTVYTALLCKHLNDRIDQLNSKSSIIMQDYRDNCITINRNVKLRQNGRTIFSGFINTVNDEGHLVLENNTIIQDSGIEIEDME